MSAESSAPTVSRAELSGLAWRPTPAGAKRGALMALVVGLVVFVAGLFVDPERAWRAFHFNWLFFTTIASAGATIAGVQRITTARWSRGVVRFIEGFAAFLPVAFVFLVLTLTVGRAYVFPWAHGAPLAAEKRLYLNPAFLVPRDVMLFGVLAGLALWFVYTSVRLDVGVTPEGGAAWARGIRARMRRGFGEERRELHSTHSRQGKIATWLVLAYGLFWVVLSWDLSMTLDLHFQSTLYGWWFFMTGWVGALMVLALLTIWWRRVLGADGIVTEHHFHDIGKLCFAFTVFWAYLTFGQYLVIWYGNLAEETHFPGLRFRPPWQAITTAVLVLTFLLPFFGLLSRAAKVYLPTLAFFAISSLVGTYLQRYIEVYPSLYVLRSQAPFGVWELGVTLLYVGVWATCYFAFLDAFPKFRVFMLTSPYRDEIQVPVDPRTMLPLPAHE